MMYAFQQDYGVYDVYFSKQVYKRREKQIYSAPFYISWIIVRLIPRAPLKARHRF